MWLPSIRRLVCVHDCDRQPTSRQGRAKSIAVGRTSLCHMNSMRDYCGRSIVEWHEGWRLVFYEMYPAWPIFSFSQRSNLRHVTNPLLLVLPPFFLQVVVPENGFSWSHVCIHFQRNMIQVGHPQHLRSVSCQETSIQGVGLRGIRGTSG